jgi:hypothetical protein
MHFINFLIALFTLMVIVCALLVETPYQAPPYCVTSPDRGQCTLTSVLYWDSASRAYIWVYDNKCNQIGFLAGLPVPSGVGNAAYVGSSLPDPVIVYFYDASKLKKLQSNVQLAFIYDCDTLVYSVTDFSQSDVRPALAYRGRSYGHTHTTSGGWNAGGASYYPFFRYATNTNFNC